MAKETVTISRDEYEHLQNQEILLIALQSAGVDNWEGYHIALEIYDEMLEE